MGELDANEDGQDAQDDGKDDFQKSKMGQSTGPEKVGLLGEGREGRESSEEPGGEERENPGGDDPRGVVADEAADQETSEDVAEKDPDRESVKAGFFGQLLN